MNDTSNNASDDIRTDEEHLLTSTISDEALEAAAGAEKAPHNPWMTVNAPTWHCC